MEDAICYTVCLPHTYKPPQKCGSGLTLTIIVNAIVNFIVMSNDKESLKVSLRMFPKVSQWRGGHPSVATTAQIGTECKRTKTKGLLPGRQASLFVLPAYQEPSNFALTHPPAMMFCLSTARRQ